MKTTVQLKYNKGDVVSVKHWSGIPEAENRYVVDGYSIRLVPGADPKILYVFHCYCNKYIGYHEQITEDRLTALEENHPHEVELDVKDVFGNDINFGDQVYYRLYYKYNGRIETPHSLCFISGGNVEEIVCTNNTGESSNSNCISVKYKRNILHTKPDGSEWLDGRRFGTESREPISCICKTVPETFYKDIIDNMSYNLYVYLDDKYDSYTFKCLMDIFGQYDKAKEYLEKTIEKKEAAKKKRQSRSTSKKKDSKLDNIAKDINELSDAERQELIDMLMNSK